jgi:hypothetical protein
MEELEKIRRVEINRNIERRCQMIDKQQGKMLTSLLNKPIRKINIDRLLEENDLTRRLITNPEEVLESTSRHFKNQFRARNF